MKALQALDSKFRYQIRLGEADFCVFIKIYHKGEYEKFREIPLEYINPNNELEKIRTFTTTVLPKEISSDEESINENEHDLTKLTSKQTRRKFKNLRAKSKKKVSDTQIIEFIYAYLRGTKISPWNPFLGVCPLEAMEEDLQHPKPGPSSAGAAEFL